MWVNTQVDMLPTLCTMKHIHQNYDAWISMLWRYPLEEFPEDKGTVITDRAAEQMHLDTTLEHSASGCDANL